MNVYCAHGDRKYNKGSRVWTCRQCGSFWYKGDEVPVMLIGTTSIGDLEELREETEVKRRQRTTKRCKMCRDMVYSLHVWCKIKAFLLGHLERI